MKNKGLVITLAVIGLLVIISVTAVLSFSLGRGWYGNQGCRQGFGRWDNNFSNFGHGRMMWGGGFQRPWVSESAGSSILSIEQAEEAVLDYIDDFKSDEELHIREIMIFDNHAYAIVEEEDTGIAAFEVLVDPTTLRISPEMGPNMMWNLKYSHMRGWGADRNYSENIAEMPISEEEAIQIANDYLESNGSGMLAEGHPDRFYGYYTIHTIKNGEISGMLSVNGYDGDIFLHTWHGEFIEMTEHEDDNHLD